MLASWTGVIIYVIAIVLAIVLGEVLKINQGILAFAFTFIIAILLGGQSASPIITQNFPGGMVFLLMITTFFYGFASSNGLIKNLSDRILYAFRKAPAAIPFVMVVIAMLMSALGASGEGTVMVVSPLFFAIAINMGFDPILAIIASGCGGVATSFFYWVGSGAFQIGMLEPMVGYDVSFAAMQTNAIMNVIVTLITFVIYYLITKGFKIKAPDNLRKPEPMTRDQKLSFTFILIAIFCLVVIPLINMIIPGIIFLTKLQNFLDIRTVMTLGVIACILAKVGNAMEVVTKKIPWNLIIMLAGMMTLIGSMSQVGTIDFLTAQFENDLHPTLAVLIMFVFPCLLGAVTGGLTVIMLVGAVAPAIAAASGLPLVVIVAVGLLGTNGMSISPYSTGGAMAISGCPDELRSKVIKRQYTVMFVYAIIALLLSLAGVTGGIASGIFGG